MLLPEARPEDWSEIHGGCGTVLYMRNGLLETVQVQRLCVHTMSEGGLAEAQTRMQSDPASARSRIVRFVWLNNNTPLRLPPGWVWVWGGVGMPGEFVPASVAQRR